VGGWKTIEQAWQNDLLKTGPTGHVNPFRQRDTGHFPLSLSELFELSAHPVVTLFFYFNTKNVGHSNITS
jgi:hypothetical protein